MCHVEGSREPVFFHSHHHPRVPETGRPNHGYRGGEMLAWKLPHIGFAEVVLGVVGQNGAEGLMQKLTVILEQLRR